MFLFVLCILIIIYFVSKSWTFLVLFAVVFMFSFCPFSLSFRKKKEVDNSYIIIREEEPRQEQEPQEIEPTELQMEEGPEEATPQLYFEFDEVEQVQNLNNTDHNGNPIFNQDTDEITILQYLQDVADEYGQDIANTLLTQYCKKANQALTDCEKRQPQLNNTDLRGYISKLELWRTDNANKRAEVDKWQSIKIKFLGHAADEERKAKNQEERIRKLGELSTVEDIQIHALSTKYLKQNLLDELFCKCPNNASQEIRKRYPIIANNKDIEQGKAYTIESYSEHLKETTFVFNEDITDQDIRNIIIDTLLTYNNRGELLDHLEDVRQRQAYEQAPEQEPTP